MQEYEEMVSAGNQVGGAGDVAWRIATEASIIPSHKADDGDHWYIMYNAADPEAELFFTASEWRAFLAGVREGEFDVD